jgi:ferritin-like metal-binding protein YciE
LRIPDRNQLKGNAMQDTITSPRVIDLLLQALTHEKGGVQVYATALKCAQNQDLRKEWEKYFQETQRHVEVLIGVCAALGIDPDKKTGGTDVVKHMGQSLVTAMEIALSGKDPAAAQLVACECVVLAETKDHLNWHLIGEVAEKAIGGDAAQILNEAYEEVEDQEDEHLYHTKGWCRELWLEALGIDAVLPPPEEKRHVTSAMEAAQAEKSRA